MEKITYEDLYAFRFLSDLKASPDGKYLLFTETRAEEEEPYYRSGLWLVEPETQKVRPLTSGVDEKGAFWMDEDTVVFRSARDQEKGEQKSRWYKISIHGGEAATFLELEGQIRDLRKLGDTTYLVTEEVWARENPVQEEVRIFDELPFWFNGRGIINSKRSVLSIYDAADGSKTFLTEAPFQVQGTASSGSRIAWAGYEQGDVEGHASRLFVYDMARREQREMELPKEMEIGNLFFITDDRLFFTGQTYEWPGRSPRFYEYQLEKESMRELPYMDGAPSSTVGTDASYGGGDKLAAKDGALYFLHTGWSHAELWRLDPDDQLTKLCDRPGQITSFVVGEQGVDMIAFRNMRLAEVWRLNPETGEEIQLTHRNDAYFAEHRLVEPEYFTFRNRAGIELEGYVLRPLDEKTGRKYPGVLEMHGGPKVVFGAVFHHEMQCLAAQGYYVFYTNPRGSDGRGEDFANLTGKLGTIDFEDFMDFTDEVIRRYPALDAKRIGICGGSYGGFMCNWMIGHTDRFAAAASQRSISNYLTKALCTDIGFYHNMAQLGTDPWHDFDTVWNTSPLKEAPQAVTPTLFIQSDEDYRCWMSDAIQMYNALQQNSTPTRMVLFHGENHELSRSGKPKNRIRRLAEIGDWFRQYLQGENAG